MHKRIALFFAVILSFALVPADIQTLRYPGLLTNPGFENAKARWTNSGSGTFTLDTSSNLAFGSNSAAWDAAANLDTLTSEQVTVPKGWYGQACVAEFLQKGGDTNLTAKVIDGGLATLVSTTLAAQTNFRSISLAFPCPTSGTVAFQLLAGANAAVVYIDQVHVGLNVGLNLGSDGTTVGTSLNVRSGSAQRAELNLYQNGTAQTTIGVATGNNDLTTGSVAGDSIVRGASDVLVTGDAGSTTVIKATNGGKLQFPHLGASKGIIESNASGDIIRTDIWTAGAEVASGGDCAASPCTIALNYGSAIDSVTRSATGLYSVVFVASFWETAPSCTVGGNRGGDTNCNANGAASISALAVNCITASTGANKDSGFTVTCVGPRL